MPYKVCQHNDGKPHHYAVCDGDGEPVGLGVYGFVSAQNEAKRLNEEEGRRYRAFRDAFHPEHWAVWYCENGAPVHKVSPTLANIADAKAVANIMERSVVIHAVRGEVQP